MRIVFGLTVGRGLPVRRQGGRPRRLRLVEVASRRRCVRQGTSGGHSARLVSAHVTPTCVVDGEIVPSLGLLGRRASLKRDARRLDVVCGRSSSAAI